MKSYLLKSGALFKKNKTNQSGHDNLKVVK